MKRELCERHYSSALVSVTHLPTQRHFFAVLGNQIFPVAFLEIKGCVLKGEGIFKQLCHFVFRSSHNNKAKRSSTPYMYSNALTTMGTYTPGDTSAVCRVAIKSINWNAVLIAFIYYQALL